MNFTGDTLLHAAPDQVWAALLDPETLQGCLPGCQRLEEVAPDTYEATVTIGIGAVKGTYMGQVRIADQEPPHSYTLILEGTGPSGSVRGSGRVSLSPVPEGTNIHWSADAQVGGPIASVGQRLIGGVAKLVAGDFFKCVDRHLTQTGATSAQS